MRSNVGGSAPDPPRFFALVSRRTCTTTERFAQKRTALQLSSRQPGRALRSLLSVALSSLPVKQFYYNMAKDSFVSVPDKLSVLRGTV